MKTVAAPRLRCAVYTRKSTEDGLEQEFNSLDAQREACEAFIVSQSSLGWKLVPDRYDDGGISGGTMERPALQRLLQDIRDRHVDVVVVYKIDRLTRSLSDFARIVDVFDAAEASFVSVTQQFNTTTSMGRLTLNVLLSFAQFEREVTAERIRDKIAASKQKGMWMGGGVPLGYRVENRKLRIDEREAPIVRYLFERYLELRSVRQLAVEATAKAFPARPLKPAGAKVLNPTMTPNPSSVRTFGRGPLYHLLSNPIYVGKVRHREKIYDGEHEAIIDPETFAAAQSLLTDQAPRRGSPSNNADLHLLTGLVYDEDGQLLRSVHTAKGKVRYRYYVSKRYVEERKGSLRGWRLPARELERAVQDGLDSFLRNQQRLADALQPMLEPDELARAIQSAASLSTRYRGTPPHVRRAIKRRLFQRIELQAASLTLRLDLSQLAKDLIGETARGTPQQGEPATLDLKCQFGLRRRGVETKLVMNSSARPTGGADPSLVRLINRAHQYLAQLTRGGGQSISEAAEASAVDRSDFSRTLRLAFLAPDLTDMILNGTQPAELTAHKLSRLSDLPYSWAEQRRIFAGNDTRRSR